MKHALCMATIIAGILFAQAVKAQDTVKSGFYMKPGKKKHGTSISLGPKGLQIYKEDSIKKMHSGKTGKYDPDDTGFSSHWVMMDLGFNTMQDKTNYNSSGAKNFLNAPGANRNSSLFNMRTGKSINVNVYPLMETFSVRNTRKQQINITTGIGLQLYNFRYGEPITFTRNPNSIVLETTSFKKDKLAFDYLNIPLMVTFKTRLFKGEYLVYGLGITGGYNLATWTKQESGQYGKVKVHDNFDFATFNTCLTGEIGLFTGIRFYGSYQLTNIYNNSLNQHPISIGFRFFGI